MALEMDLDALNSLAAVENNLLCPCSYQAMGRKHNLIYQFHGPTLTSIASQKMNYMNFCRLLKAGIELVDYLQTKNMYLKNIQIKGKDIFYEIEQFQFVYLPVQQSKDISIKKFFLKLVHVVPSKDEGIASLKKQLKGLETYQSIKEFIEALSVKEKIVEEMSVSIYESEAETSLLNENMDQQVLESEGETTLLAQQEAEPELPQEEESEGETTILSQETTAFMVNEFSECETTVLSDMVMPVVEETHAGGGMYDLFLLRVSSGERIHINKSVYSIGKDINNMDYVLGNASVSRNHATIYSEGDKFYIVDNGSTNGSTLEGVRIREGERVELGDGYIVSLGNEVFQILLERKIS